MLYYLRISVHNLDKYSQSLNIDAKVWACSLSSRIYQRHIDNIVTRRCSSANVVYFVNETSLTGSECFIGPQVILIKSGLTKLIHTGYYVNQNSVKMIWQRQKSRDIAQTLPLISNVSSSCGRFRCSWKHQDSWGFIPVHGRCPRLLPWRCHCHHLQQPDWSSCRKGGQPWILNGYISSSVWWK